MANRRVALRRPSLLATNRTVKSLPSPLASGDCGCTITEKSCAPVPSIATAPSVIGRSPPLMMVKVRSTTLLIGTLPKSLPSATFGYIAPAVTSVIPPGMAGPPPCDIAARVTGAGTDHVTVDIDLTFSASSAQANRIMADCWTGEAHNPVVRSYVVGPVPATAKLFTGKPAPDTPLPKMTEPPR